MQQNTSKRFINFWAVFEFDPKSGQLRPRPGYAKASKEFLETVQVLAGYKAQKISTCH